MPRLRRSWPRCARRSRSVHAVSEQLPVLAPFAGTVVAVREDGEHAVMAGQTLVVLEAMKMEHEVVAEVDGTVRAVEVAVGDTVEPGQRLAVLEPADFEAPARDEAAAPEDQPRDELEAVRARHE